MAEIIVNFVVNKLRDAVLQEIFFLCGVHDKVEHMQLQLNLIQCFLKDADRKRYGDERVRSWVNELRDVSHSIEDAVDVLILEVDNEKVGSKEDIKRTFKKPAKIAAIHKFEKEVDKILTRIDEIIASRETYGIENLGESCVRAEIVPMIPDCDETVELDGFGDEEEQIMQKLLDEECSRRPVLSIVGPSGLGKSSVAKKAYSCDAVKSKFDVRMWISISQSFTLINLLKKILEGIRPLEKKDKDHDEEYFKKEVNMSLREKKYLIVLDDVWSENLWPQIAPALPDVNNGSRVLITSRFLNVPISADPESQPVELRVLSEEESLELLLKTAIPNQASTEGSVVADISHIAKQLAQKCDGLPLALVVLGGLLSLKPLTCHAWENVLKTMVCSDQGKRYMDILETGYDDMSVDLKSCFLYLACYPEDDEICADELIRLWIAEGLIPHISGRIREDTAENYLEKLVQRNMVQVLKRSPWGSIETCRLHYLLHDVAIKKAKEDDFFTVCSNRDEEPSCGMARRVTVHHSNCDVMKHASSNLRSLLCFHDDIKTFSERRLLRVLHCGHGHTYSIGGLTQLRYLRFMRKGMWDYDLEYLSQKIGGLKYLQTLDFSHQYTKLKMPDGIWHVKTLRHVLVNRCQFAPPPWANLQNLQTLCGFYIPVSWEATAVPNLPNLRVLHIIQRILKGFAWDGFVAFLHTLKKLQHLKIKSDKTIPMEVVDMRPFPFYDHLKSLEFEGRLSQNQLDDAAIFPPNITMLRLCDTEIGDDTMRVIEKLQGLKDLSLVWGFYKGKEVRCTSGGLPRLEKLYIQLEGRLEWEIEEGAMPVLKNLTIHSFLTGQEIRGLEHITTIRNLTYKT